MNMKFVKGMLIGTAVSAGAIMMYEGWCENNGRTRKKMMKKGKQYAKKLGIM